MYGAAVADTEGRSEGRRAYWQQHGAYRRAAEGLALQCSSVLTLLRGCSTALRLGRHLAVCCYVHAFMACL